MGVRHLGMTEDSLEDNVTHVPVLETGFGFEVFDLLIQIAFLLVGIHLVGIGFSMLWLMLEYLLS